MGLLKTSQLNAISGTAFVELTTTDVGALTTTQLAGLNATSVERLTSTRVGSLTSDQLSAPGTGDDFNLLGG
ncbi:MAG: hypothetical protein NVV72_00775 [Asticcacaulis sp.]|nr:hypothetical protein [Asticcacaulis sp.]